MNEKNPLFSFQSREYKIFFSYISYDNNDNLSHINNFNNCKVYCAQSKCSTREDRSFMFFLPRDASKVTSQFSSTVARHHFSLFTLKNIPEINDQIWLIFRILYVSYTMCFVFPLQNKWKILWKNFCKNVAAIISIHKGVNFVLDSE